MQQNEITHTATWRSSIFKKSTFVEVIALFFVILFIYTGVSKLLDFNLTVEQMADSPPIKNYAEQLAWGVPLVEFIISVLLFIPKTRRIGLWATLGIMIAFTAYIIYILNYSPHIPCSCGGIISALSWKDHLVFNSVCVLLAALALWLNRKKAITL